MYEKFFPEYKKFIYFLEKRHKEKLDNTKNQIENYMGNTMLRTQKEIQNNGRSIQPDNASKMDGLKK